MDWLPENEKGLKLGYCNFGLGPLMGQFLQASGVVYSDLVEQPTNRLKWELVQVQVVPVVQRLAKEELKEEIVMVMVFSFLGETIVQVVEGQK